MAAVLAAYGAQVQQNTTPTAPAPRSTHAAAVAEPRHLYRALVGYRAQPWFHVSDGFDALPTSRPTLERVGFSWAATTPYTWSP